MDSLCGTGAGRRGDTSITFAITLPVDEADTVQQAQASMVPATLVGNISSAREIAISSNSVSPDSISLPTAASITVEAPQAEDTVHSLVPREWEAQGELLCNTPAMVFLTTGFGLNLAAGQDAVKVPQSRLLPCMFQHSLYVHPYMHIQCMCITYTNTYTYAVKFASTSSQPLTLLAGSQLLGSVPDLKHSSCRYFRGEAHKRMYRLHWPAYDRFAPTLSGALGQRPPAERCIGSQRGLPWADCGVL